MAAAAELPPPHRNHDLVGHQGAERSVLQALAAGRMPHAWIISGPAGVGKETLAFRIARYVLAAGREVDRLAAEADSLQVSPDHPAARRITAGAHPDLLTVVRAGDNAGDSPRRSAEIPVEDARRIAPFLHKTPAEGGWRVVVLDGVERMNRNAANAILKVVEEPPDRALVLMTCETPGALLPTIRSRCRMLPLSSLDPAEVSEFLVQRAIVSTPAEADALARLCEGRIGHAIALASVDGVAIFRRFLDLFEPGGRLDLAATQALADELAGNRAGGDGWRLLRILISGWIGRMVRQAAGAADTFSVIDAEARLLGAVQADRTDGGSLDRWLEVWEKTHDLFASIEQAHLDRRHGLTRIAMIIGDALSKDRD